MRFHLRPLYHNDNGNFCLFVQKLSAFSSIVWRVETVHLLALSDTPKEFDISILQQSLGGNNEIKVTIRWNTVR